MVCYSSCLHGRKENARSNMRKFECSNLLLYKACGFLKKEATSGMYHLCWAALQSQIVSTERKYRYKTLHPNFWFFSGNPQMLSADHQ